MSRDLLRALARTRCPLWASRRPPGKARGVRIPGVCKRRATQPGGVHRRPQWIPWFLPGTLLDRQASRPPNGISVQGYRPAGCRLREIARHDAGDVSDAVTLTVHDRLARQSLTAATRRCAAPRRSRWRSSTRVDHAALLADEFEQRQRQRLGGRWLDAAALKRATGNDGQAGIRTHGSHSRPLHTAVRCVCTPTDRITDCPPSTALGKGDRPCRP